MTEGERDPENVLRIGNVANHEQNVYTFQEAWEIARANSGTAYVFKLNENINITSGIIKNQVKTDVTIDLNGYTFTCKNKYYLVSYENGSTGSSLALISSREGGKLIVDCFVCIGSGAKSVVNVSCGSDDGYPITVDSVHATYGYLAYMAGNFKGGSTLNLSIKNGTYNLYHGLLFVNNYGTNANNVYKLDVSNSVVSMGNACIGFSGSFRAASGSYINAVNSTFKATEGTELILASAQWDGSLEFDNCRFEGIVFDQSTLASVSGAVFKEGCSFANFGATFNGDNSAFASDKLTFEDGYMLYTDTDGSVSVIEIPPIPDNVLYIAKTANHTLKIYTWLEAWNIAMANPDTAYIFILTEVSNMGGTELLKVTSRCNVTLDLAGYTMTVSKNSNYLVSFSNGSSGSSFSVISSKEGGAYNGPTLVYASSSGASNLTFAFGSQESYPIHVTTFKTTGSYSSKGSLIGVDGNFKNGSTLTATVTNGTFILEGEVLNARNYSGSLNTFKVSISNSDITVGTAVINFASTHNTTASSYFNAYSSTISASAGTVIFTAANQWFGSLEFDDCAFFGIVFDASTLTNISGGIFKEGCTFANFGATFTDDKSAFASAKLATEDGYAPRLNSSGVVVIDTISRVVGVSITLSDDISINFYAVLSEAHNGSVMKFIVDGQEVLISGILTADGKWKYTFSGIGPQAMTVPIQAVLIFDGEVVYTHDPISVKSYSDALLDMSHEELGITEEKLGDLKALVTNLLQYGACAQIYKGYNVENLANEGIDSSLLLEFTDPNMAPSVGETKTPGMQFTGATVWFDSVNSICIRFTLTDPERTTIRVNGVEYDSSHFNEIGANTYTFFTDPIPASQYQSSFVFQLCLDGVVQQEAVYSVACYVTSMQSSTDESMVNLARAMYNYGVAAREYIS